MDATRPACDTALAVRPARFVISSSEPIMIRWVAPGLAVLFTLVVAMGYLPSFVTAVQGEAPTANLMLNAPHVAIATVTPGLVYWWVPRESAPAAAR